jgi:hypothetical protein
VDPKGQSLLKLLFNEGETVCVSNNKFAYHSIPLQNALNGKISLISSNPDVQESYCDSSDLTLCAINPIKGYRCDKNVTAFRSFLIEMDSGSIKDQLGTIEHVKLPFSAQVFSGSKSVHTVITVDRDLPSKKDYDYIAEWIFNIMTMADKNCANPSRSIRIPGVYREPGKKQRLITIKNRISLTKLIDWLKKYEHLRPKIKEQKRTTPIKADYSRLSPWCRVMLTKGIVFRNGRNSTWFSIAVDFALAGFTEDETIKILSQKFVEEHDFKEKEFLSSIYSGFKYANEGKS